MYYLASIFIVRIVIICLYTISTNICAVAFRTANYVRQSLWMPFCLLLNFFWPYSVMFFMNVAAIITFTVNRIPPILRMVSGLNLCVNYLELILCSCLGNLKKSKVSNFNQNFLLN